MKKKIISLFKYIIAFMVIFLAVSWYRAPSIEKPVNLQFVSIKHHPIDLVEESQNKPVLVYFWGSWCHICSLTSPAVEALSQDGYSVVTIALHSGNDEVVKKYLQNKNYHFETVNDQQGKIFYQWGGTVTPSFVIIKNGQVKQSFSGIQAGWSLKLRMWLNQFL